MRRVLIAAPLVLALALPAAAARADHLCVPRTAVCADFCVHAGGDPWHPPVYCTR